MNKICTSVEQSKKLIELGIDANTADMYWWYSGKRYYVESMDDDDFNEEEGHVRAWSLAALLNVLPSVIKRNGKRMFLTLEKAGAYNLYYKSSDRLDELWETKEEPIDACYGMILNLNELNLL